MNADTIAEAKDNFYRIALEYLDSVTDMSAYHAAFRNAADVLAQAPEHAGAPLYVHANELIQECVNRAALDHRRKLRLSLIARELVAALPPEASGPPMPIHIP